MLAGMLSRDALRDPDSAGFNQAIGACHEMMVATPAYASLSPAFNARADHIAAGRQ